MRGFQGSVWYQAQPLNPSLPQLGAFHMFGVCLLSVQTNLAMLGEGWWEL